MRAYAKAKINLSLDVKEKRPDGYHEIDTVFQTIGLCDLIEINEKEGPGITFSCSDPSVPGDESNLAVRAARLFADEYGIAEGVDIYLEKIIPSGAGLGGGSSDAACVLVMMNKLFGAGADEEQLETLGARLGSDVPFFIKGGAARARGRGEKLQQVSPLRDCYVVIVKPLCHSSTKAAYEKLDAAGAYSHPDVNKMAEALAKGDTDSVFAAAGNSFEDVYEAACPGLPEIKEMLKRNNAGCAMLAGSGSAVFGLFKEKKDAENACAFIKDRDPGYRVFLSCCIN